MEIGKGEIPHRYLEVFFSPHTEWNSLPEHVVEAEILGVFKTRLDIVQDTIYVLSKQKSRSTFGWGKGEHCWAEWPVLAITLLFYVNLTHHGKWFGANQRQMWKVYSNHTAHWALKQLLYVHSVSEVRFVSLRDLYTQSYSLTRVGFGFENWCRRESLCMFCKKNALRKRQRVRL